MEEGDQSQKLTLLYLLGQTEPLLSSSWYNVLMTLYLKQGISKKITKPHKNPNLAKFSIPKASNFTVGKDQATSENDFDLPKEMEEVCRTLYDQYAHHQLNKILQDSPEQQWLISTSADTSLTLTDRVSSLGLLITQAPLLNLARLRDLINLINRKNNRKEAFIIIDAIKTIFMSSLLPPNKKLYNLSENWKHYSYPFLSDILTILSTIANTKNDFDMNHLIIKQPYMIYIFILWHFEHHIKKEYIKFIKLLIPYLYDTVETIKHKTLLAISDLLIHHPEQEQTLLKTLVVKLGDPRTSLATLSSKLLVNLIEKQPGMKETIIQFIGQDVMRFISTFDISKYRLLTKKKSNRHNKLRKSTSNSEFIQEKFISKLANIYHPLLFLSEIKYKRSEENIASYCAHLYLHLLNMFLNDKSTSLFKKSSSITLLPQTNRIIRVLLIGLHRAYPFISGFDKSLSNLLTEKNESTRKGLDIEVLYKALHQLPTHSTKIVLLQLLYQLSNSFRLPLDRLYRALYEKLNNHEIYQAKNVISLFNLIYLLIKQDKNSTRPHSLFKRLTQMALSSDSPSLILATIRLGNSLKKEGILNHYPFSFREKFFLQDTEESFLDLDIDNLEQDTNDLSENKNVHYDPVKRDPRFSRADESHAWESLFSVFHYNPEVRFEAHQLRNSTSNQKYKPSNENSFVSDLQNYFKAHTLSNFLDMICDNYKPKKRDTNSSEDSPHDASPIDTFMNLYYLDPIVEKQTQRKNDNKRGKAVDVNTNLSHDDSDQEEELFAYKLFEQQLGKV